MCVCHLQYVFRRAVTIRGILARTTSALLHPSRKPLQHGVTPPRHHHTADVSLCIMSSIYKSVSDIYV